MDVGGTRERPARTGRNPRTGEAISIADSLPRARGQGREGPARRHRPIGGSGVAAWHMHRPGEAQGGRPTEAPGPASSGPAPRETWPMPLSCHRADTPAVTPRAGSGPAS